MLKLTPKDLEVVILVLEDLVQENKRRYLYNDEISFLDIELIIRKLRFELAPF